MINGTWIEDRVGISGIAYRVSKHASDPQLLVRRPADVADSGRIAIIIIGARVLGVEPAGADRIIKIVDLAVALAPFAERVVRSAFGSNHCAWSFCALFREDLNDSCKCARSVDRALRPAYNLNPVDVIRRDVGEVHRAR